MRNPPGLRRTPGRRLRPAALLVTLAIAAATPARAEALPGFRPGERFVFNFSLGSIQAGRARLSVGTPASTPAGGRVALLGDAETAPWLAVLARVRDRYQALLDVEGLPYTRKVQIEEHGLRERTIDFALDRHAAGTLLKLDVASGAQRVKEVHQLAGTPFDLVGSLFFIRMRPLDLGERFEFVFFDGPLFYKAQAQVLGREDITWAGGPARAIRLDVVATRIGWVRPSGPVPERKHAVLLLSDDSDHVPYRVEGDTDFGTCTLELTAYEPGLDPVPLAPARPAPPALSTPPVVRPATGVLPAPAPLPSPVRAMLPPLRPAQPATPAPAPPATLSPAPPATPDPALTLRAPTAPGAPSVAAE